MFLGYGVCAVILLVLVLFLTKRVELQRKPSAQVELAFSQGMHQHSICCIADSRLRESMDHILQS